MKDPKLDINKAKTATERSFEYPQVYLRSTDIHVPVNIPALFYTSKSPLAVIGGFVTGVDTKSIKLDFANSIKNVTTGVTNSTLSYRFYKLEKLEKYITLPIEDIQTSGFQMSKEKGGIMGKVNAPIGDFITMGQNGSQAISGFIEKVEVYYITLIHENPLTNKSERNSIRKAFTLGRNTYDLRNFDSWQVFDTRKNTELE
jgi:hypothetical protein